MKTVIILLSALFLTACFDSGDAQAKEENRTKLGKATFDKNCVSCHGKDARGTSTNWKRLLPNGKYPAPLIAISCALVLFLSNPRYLALANP
jgi:mono/diheme cytochrome c family protein